MENNNNETDLLQETMDEMNDTYDKLTRTIEAHNAIDALPASFTREQIAFWSALYNYRASFSEAYFIGTTVYMYMKQNGVEKVFPPPPFRQTNYQPCPRAPSQ
jgi:hypothetical protein